MHFGVAFSAACGTPVVVIGDGVGIKVDARQHDSGPNILLIAHTNGYVLLYARAPAAGSWPAGVSG